MVDVGDKGRDARRRGDAEQGERRFTIVEFAALVGVPASAVRSWCEYDLLPRAPVRTRRAFGYRDLARARTLARFHAAGWSARRIRAALDGVRRLVESDDEALAGIDLETDGRQVTMRLDDGRLSTGTGQQLFDFAASSAGEGAAVHGIRSAAEWFQLGVEREAGGDLAAAIAAYERSLPTAGAAAWFNLGNCRYQRRDLRGAEQAFSAAVTADPEYAEAWNNLGIVRGLLEDEAGAVAAFGRALALRPHYADAHYNLADALASAGDLTGARRHWRAYLTFDPNSQWAEQVRRRLSAADGR